MEMERLTERLDGDGLCYGKVDCEDNCTYCDRFLKVLDKLADYEDAEEQGLLLRLPCKVGSTVYYIDDYEIYSDKVDSINIRKENEEYIFCIAFMDYRAEDFGRNVFLTREEAEQALKQMGER